ncbi:hypothetical protein BH11BAC2_BH11BAC2_00810 [soil metagenome]
MALNKNHEFEELDGVKCCIVERSVTTSRAEFLRTLLTGNGFTVIVSGIVPKTPPPTAVAEGETPLPPAPTPVPTAFTVGVTGMTYNTINAIFGRQLRTKEGHVVTLAYWKQQELISNEEIPYFEK